MRNSLNAVALVVGLVFTCMSLVGCGGTGVAANPTTQVGMNGGMDKMNDGMDKMDGSMDKMDSNKMGMDKMDGKKMSMDKMNGDKMAKGKMTKDKMEQASE
jgi:hypothetical protein